MKRVYKVTISQPHYNTVAFEFNDVEQATIFMETACTFGTVETQCNLCIEKVEEQED